MYNDNEINAWCDICGKGYHVCNTCRNQTTFKPWRTVVDSIDHYKIYLAIHLYTTTKDKKAAKEELSKCDLRGLDEFRPTIKAVIHEIMDEPVKIRKKPSKVVEIVSNEDATDVE